jgi:hypothetical protein
MSLQFLKNPTLHLQFMNLATPSQNAPPGLTTTKAPTASRQDGTSLTNPTSTRVVASQTSHSRLMLTKSSTHSPTWLIGSRIAALLTSPATITSKLFKASPTRPTRDRLPSVWLSTMSVTFISHSTPSLKLTRLTSPATRAVMPRNYQPKTVSPTSTASGTQLLTVTLDTQLCPFLPPTGPGTALNQPQWQRPTPQLPRNSTTATSANGPRKDLISLRQQSIPVSVESDPTMTALLVMTSEY